MSNTATCPGDYNLGLPCQTCGSTGQFIGEFEEQYLNNWSTNYEKVNTCGDCQDFDDQGCKTSYLEAKYGSAGTPACNEFKSKEDK